MRTRLQTEILFRLRQASAARRSEFNGKNISSVVCRGIFNSPTPRPKR